MVKCLVFFFKATTTSASQVKFFLCWLKFNFTCMSWKSFVPPFFKVSGKRNYCLMEKFGKSLEFWIKNLIEP